MKNSIIKIDNKNMLSNGMDIVKKNLEVIQNIFPEVVKDGEVDFDALKAILGCPDSPKNERFNFTWHGKEKSRMLAQSPSNGTLRPLVTESINWETSNNIFVEGDNVEVLKVLQKSYHNSVKMIYIDPPYNTGNDFVYKDDFSDNIKNYLEFTGQLDSGGKKIGTNSDLSGRYHSAWLSMMYPRLKLAKNLLKKDGVIFISISDEEVGNLRLLCDEVFGEDNFQGHIHWRRRHNQPNDKTKMLGLVAEHILSYSKDKNSLKEYGVGKMPLTGSFTNPDNDPLGDWASKPWKVGSDQNGSKYSITLPNGQVMDGEWMGDENTYKKHLEEGRMYFPKNGSGSPRKKYYQFEREQEGQCATNWFSHEIFGHNQEGNDELTKIMDGIKNTFSNPKPTKLIKNLMNISGCKDNDIIMDFFAGSGTTFDAASEFNNKIKSITVQLPEPLNSSKKEHKEAIEFCINNNKPMFLSELTKERIRRANANNKGSGIKVFKLDETNIRPWDADFDNLELVLQQATDSIKPDRSSEDVLYEIFLKYGYDLTTPVETKTVSGKKVFVVGAGALIVCLDDEITGETVEGIAKLKEELDPETTQVVFKDAGFSDSNVKTNAIQILKQAGIDDVKSI